MWFLFSVGAIHVFARLICCFDLVLGYVVSYTVRFDLPLLHSLFLFTCAYTAVFHLIFVTKVFQNHVCNVERSFLI